jgi:hypothetical protein
MPVDDAMNMYPSAVRPSGPARRNCGAAYWTEVDAPETTQSKSEEAGMPLVTIYREPKLRARQRRVVLGRRIGFETLRTDNAEAWRELWRGRVVLLGADRRWQSLADAAFFYLHTSTHRGSFSTHPFGLAQWQGYRIRSTDSARENARLNGFLGVQFPWEGSPSRGEEAAPGLGPAAAFEHHVSADVAKALADYVHATGDDVFFTDRAWPVLSGVAEWIASRAIRTNRGWEIHKAMGIAEREHPSNNAAFVNMAAAVAMREAIGAAERLRVEPPAPWRSVAEGMVIPTNRAGVILDHDGYTRREEKASTPAALAGLFPLGFEVDAKTERATLRYYLDMADDYAGSPMLSALLGAWAAMLGDRARSSYLFEEGYAKFHCDRFNVVHEYRDDKFPDEPVSGPFMANMGAFLISCIYGLTGIRIGPGDPTEWSRRPVVMPELWDGVEMDRIHIRGRDASLRAKHGDERATIEFHNAA